MSTHGSVPPPYHPPLGSVPPPDGFDRDRVSRIKVIAGVLGILLGGFGIHKFVIGAVVPGVIMLVVTLLGTCAFVGLGWALIGLPCGLAPGAMGVIGLVEGIIYLTKSDEDFNRIYLVGKRGWF
jgi:TM2 domain-containing membrane protein YozV